MSDQNLSFCQQALCGRLVDLSLSWITQMSNGIFSVFYPQVVARLSCHFHAKNKIIKTKKAPCQCKYDQIIQSCTSLTGLSRMLFLLISKCPRFFINLYSVGFLHVMVNRRSPLINNYFVLFRLALTK